MAAQAKPRRVTLGRVNPVVCPARDAMLPSVRPLVDGAWVGVIWHQLLCPCNGPAPRMVPIMSVGPSPGAWPVHTFAYRVIAAQGRRWVSRCRVSVHHPCMHRSPLHAATTYWLPRDPIKRWGQVVTAVWKMRTMRGAGPMDRVVDAG